MATAYAAFTSLMHLIEDLLEHPNPPIKLDDEHVDSLSSNISFFQSFLEKHHNTIDRGLEILMADAAHTAEDLIETHIADRIKDHNEFNGRLQEVIESLDLLQKEVTMKMSRTTEQCEGNRSVPLASAQSHSAPSSISSDVKLGGPFKGIITKIKDKLTRKNNQQPTQHLGSSQPYLSAATVEDVVVGIEGTTLKIVDKLTSKPKYGPQLFSITGMGGIGKTTLARKIYSHPIVRSYFDTFAWATISKDYDTRRSLVELVACLNGEGQKESLSEKSESELGDLLHKSLFGRRYLVIVDDLWDVEAWEEVRRFFPSSKGSGIVITTREASVASIGTDKFLVDFLDERNGWDLFREKVFEKESCPLELEDIGRNIAKKCRGLPLSLAVIGGHLAKSPRTKKYWGYVAENLSSVVNAENDEYCLKILSLSYNHLPVHLKPCFMYMGIFPEDKEIEISLLIKLWVAEGFLKPISGKSQEDAAKDYIKDLIGRNLILACELSFLGVGDITHCRIHDLLRDLCLKEAFNKNFFCKVCSRWPGVMKVSSNERRIVVHPSSSKAINYIYGIVGVLRSPKDLRTLIINGVLPSKVYYKTLRVLCSVEGSLEIKQKTWEKDVPTLINLRLFLGSVRMRPVEFPSSFVSLWNLQSLLIESTATVIAPLEIWEMTQLRHIDIGLLNLPDPPAESNGILMKLQSAMTLRNFSFSEDFVRRIPNIRELKVDYDDEVVEGFKERKYTLDNIDRLEKLESLDCSFVDVQSMTIVNHMLANIKFPHSLKELRISNLRWEDVTTKIGSLPRLEELGLLSCPGRQWNLVEGKFISLKCLTLIACEELECFTADDSHFRSLEILGLSLMPGLERISSDIGDTASLRSITLIDCPDSAVKSAKEIAREQLDEMGNDVLQIYALVFSNKSALSPESTSNFRLQVYSGP